MGCKGNFLQRLNAQDMNCKRNVPTVKKREVEMGVGDWEVEISRPIDCKK